MYVQNGTQRITVYVKKDEGGGGTHKTNDEKSPEELVNEKKNMSRRRLKRIIWTNTTHMLAVTRQVGNMAFNYWLSGINDKHGDQSLQDQYHRTVERLEDKANIASSIAMGGVYGSWGGPIGGIIGATLGAISSSASVGFKYARREREFNVRVFKEQNGIEYMRARANLNLTTGRRLR